MGRVSACQKNCNTIDLRGAQVNKICGIDWPWRCFTNVSRALQNIPSKYVRTSSLNYVRVPKAYKSFSLKSAL